LPPLIGVTNFPPKYARLSVRGVTGIIPQSIGEMPVRFT
jgi:hypothetical protein